MFPPPRWGEVVEFDMNGGLSMIAVGAEKKSMEMPFLKIREQFTAIILCAKNFLIDSGPIYCNNDSIFSKILYRLQ